MAFRCRTSAAGITQRALDGCRRRLLKGSGLQVSKMTISEPVGIVACRAGVTFVAYMLVVLTRIVAVVLARTVAVAGAALSIDIDRAASPVRCGSAATTADVRTGAIAVAGCRTALGVPGRCYATIHLIVVRSAGVAAGAIISDAIQGGMHAVGAGRVRRIVTGRRLAMAAVAGPGVGVAGFEGVQPVDKIGFLGRRHRPAVTGVHHVGKKSALTSQVDAAVGVITGDLVTT